VCTATVSAQLQPGAPWPIYGQNASGQAASPFSGPVLKEYLKAQWMFGASCGSMPFEGAAVIDANGTVYVACGNVYALNGDTGAVNWQFTTPSEVPVIGAGGILYILSDNDIFALNSSNGAIIWQLVDVAFQPEALAMRSDGLLLITSSVAVYAVKTQVGPDSLAEVAGVNAQLMISGGATIYNDVLYFSAVGIEGNPPQLYTYPNMWTYQWNVGACRMTGAPTIGPDGTVYVICDGTAAFAFNSVTGALLWRNTYNQVAYEYKQVPSFSVGPDGTLYVGSAQYLFALNGSTGTQQWNYTAGGLMLGSASIGANGIVYIGSQDQNVYAFNGSTGAMVWHYALGSTISTQLSIGSSGNLYVVSDTFIVYALAARIPPSASTTPTPFFTAAPTISVTTSASFTPACTPSSSWSPSASYEPTSSFTPSSTTTSSPTGSVPSPSHMPTWVFYLIGVLVAAFLASVLARWWWMGNCKRCLRLDRRPHRSTYEASTQQQTEIVHGNWIPPSAPLLPSQQYSIQEPSAKVHHQHIAVAGTSDLQHYEAEDPQ
jgi:outer membrane protein assembly factor BamB